MPEQTTYEKRNPEPKQMTLNFSNEDIKACFIDNPDDSEPLRIKSTKND